MIDGGFPLGKQNKVKTKQRWRRELAVRRAMSASALILPETRGRAGSAEGRAVTTLCSHLVLVFASGQRAGIMPSDCMLFFLQSWGLWFCFVFKLLNFKL